MRMIVWTVIIAALVAGVFLAIVITGIRNRKRGKNSCSCGCGGCAIKDTCRSKK